MRYQSGNWYSLGECSIGCDKNKTVVFLCRGFNKGTGNIHLNILEVILEPQLQDYGILDIDVFQHDSASPHSAYIIHVT